MFTGCKLSKFDLRDYKIKARAVQLPVSYYLPQYSRIKDQGTVGSCVAHATSSVLEYYDKGHSALSTNFIYGFQNRMSGGMYLKDACKIAQQYGDMLEADCPGNVEVPMCHQKYLTAAADKTKMDKASRYRIQSYFNCNTDDDIKYAIMNYGPCIAALRWYDGFSASSLTGNLTVNCSGSMCYHCIMIYGWDETGFWCQNSWGRNWGKEGIFHIKYSDNLIAEAKALVDCINTNELNVVMPKTNKVLDIFYKGVNCVLNGVLNFLRK